MLVLDLENSEAVREAVLGLGMVEIVINNAGGPPGGPLLENKLDEFEGPFLAICMHPIQLLRFYLQECRNRIW